MILGASILQLPAIEEALKMGLQVIAVDMNPSAVGFSVPGVIKEVISTNDTDKVLNCARKHKIDGITTICTDYPMRTVAKVASELGLPGISEQAAINATDKSKMRVCLEKAGLPIPKYCIVHSITEYLEHIKEFGANCVVKAVDNSGSRGIQLVKDLSDKEKLINVYNYCKQFSRSGDILLEEFMEGPEICVETLSVNGICYPIQVTDQLAKQPPYFTDAGYSQPSLLGEETINLIKDIAVKTNLALENFNGSSCTEMIVTKDGPKVVEIGPRLAGDCMTTHLVPLSTGINMVRAVINIALGNPVEIEQKFSKGSCIRYYMKPVVGKIVDIKGIEEAKSMPGIKQVTILKGIGEMATELRSSGDRIAFAIAQADTAENAIKCCENALNRIDVIVEKE